MKVSEAKVLVEKVWPGKEIEFDQNGIGELNWSVSTPVFDITFHLDVDYGTLDFYVDCSLAVDVVRPPLGESSPADKVCLIDQLVGRLQAYRELSLSWYAQRGSAHVPAIKLQSADSTVYLEDQIELDVDSLEEELENCLQQIKAVWLRN